MKKTNKKSIFFSVVLLFLSVLGIIGVGSTMTAEAKEVSLVTGASVQYMGYSTHYYYVDGKLSYCLEPDKASPHTGNFTAQLLDKNQLLSKTLYYVYGAPGYEAYLKPRIPESWKKDADAYCLSHCILAYVYDNCSESSDAFKGLSEQMRQTVRDCVGYIRTFPDPVEPEISFSKTDVTAYFDEEEKVQRT